MKNNYLNDITFFQINIINKLRLTNKYKKMYGNFFIKNFPNGKVVQNAISNIEKYKNVKGISIKKNKKNIIDYLYACNILGFLPWEYFSYNLEGKSIKKCLNFIPLKQVLKIYKVFNINVEENHKLGNKILTYNILKKLYKRDIINISTEDDYNKFSEFIKKNKKFIVKPFNSKMGRGISVKKIDNNTNVKKLFNEIISEGNVICEEYVYNSEEIKKIHPNSLNTCRIVSYYNGKEVKILCAWIKFGVDDNIVDNGSSGGIVCAIDIGSGKIISNGSTELNANYKVHPNSKIKFKGYKIPDFNQAIELVNIASKKMKSVPLIGWDVALTNKGWIIIEGNEGSQTNIYQIATKKGMKKIFEDNKLL